MIIYPQYPEARLSGFDPVDGNMPSSLSIAYTKANPEAKRYLLVARRGQGDALGMMILNPSSSFAEEIAGLGSAPQSRVWKKIQLNLDSSSELKTLLSNIVSRTHDGCGLVASGEIVPFSGTQVCGFTLEKSLGIIPNSDKHGDFKGIELKTHTQKKSLSLHLNLTWAYTGKILKILWSSTVIKIVMVLIGSREYTGAVSAVRKVA